MKCEFFMAMQPPTATHQEKQVRVVKGKPVFYDPPEVKAARAKLTAHLARHRPDAPMQGPVRLVVKWCFPLEGDHQDGEYRTSKPDTDNLQKLLKDCMTASGFWKDDAQVASEVAEKFWAEQPGLFVSVAEIGRKVCETCGWYAGDEGVCCNGDSEYRADFRGADDSCPCWHE